MQRLTIMTTKAALSHKLVIYLAVLIDQFLNLFIYVNH